MKRLVTQFATLVLAAMLICPMCRELLGAITVTSNAPWTQINSGGLPGTHIREHSTLWDENNANTGTMFYVDSSSGKVVTRTTTTDGGLNWTAGVDTGLTTPPGAASTDERNPVVRDFNRDGNLTGFFGTLQGSPGGPYVPNKLLFTATSADNGASWSGESLVTFNAGAFPGQTGMNGFIEVFETSAGKLRGYTAMNKIIGSAAHIVESTDGGATWTDLGAIVIGGKDNIIGANSPVFTFTDNDDGLTKMGWFVFGESAHRGVHLVTSTDEGQSWGLHTTLLADSSVRSGDANFLSDTQLRLFYYRNTGSSPSNRQLWYEDYTLSGMSKIVPNNLTGSGGGPTPIIPEPATIAVWALLGLSWAALGVWRRRKGPVAELTDAAPSRRLARPPWPEHNRSAIRQMLQENLAN